MQTNKKEINLFTILSNITEEEKNRWEEFKSIYNAYMVNRYLSMSASLVPYVKLVNRYVLTPEMQYDLLHRIIPKKHRFLPYQKKEENSEEIQDIMEVMDVSSNKAKELALTLKKVKIPSDDK